MADKNSPSTSISEILANWPYEECIDLAPGVQRITQKNPGPFTGPGTNTHLVGDQQVFILDPGVLDDTHYEAIVTGVGPRKVLGVYSSHSHPDHWPLGAQLASHYGAQTLGYAKQSGYEPDRLLADEEVLETDDRKLHCLHTPGHASDHLCLVDEEHRCLFSGDHIMGWSTTIIGPPDGSLNEYMASLDRLLKLDFGKTYPAHGDTIENGKLRAQELYEHRQQRTEQALQALRAGLTTVTEMVRQIYADTPEHLHPAAAQSLWAHLDALVESGVVTRGPGEPLEALYRLV